MKLVKQSRVIAGLVTLLGCLGPAWAADIISVDMDLTTAGIQSIRRAAPGDTFQIGLVMTVDAAGVSSYGISALFDTAELSLNGSPAATNLPFAGAFTFGDPIENNALGRVYTFNAATFGTGPSLTTFTFGTIKYTAVTPATDLIEDISLGFFNVGIDGFFDNAGNPVVPTFNGGFVNVPEPGTVSLLLCGMAATWLVRRRRTMQARNVGLL